MKYLLGYIFLIVLFVSSTFALSCTPTSIERSIETGGTPISQIISCGNTHNYNVEIFKSGNFFSTTPASIIVENGTTKEFTVNFNQMNTEGKFSGYLFSSDGTTINIKVNVTSQVIPGDIIVFPTTKIVNIKQGQTKDQNIQVIVPVNYPNQIILQSVSFNPDLDVVRFGDLNLGILNPGQTISIPLIIDAKLVQTGSYNTQITILATDEDGQIPLPQVNMQVVVQIGTSPITNTTFSTRPECSLSSLEMNLNNSYVFSCGNIVENLEVNPQYNSFFEGKKAEYGAGNYVYTFKAKKLGATTFISTFTYKGSPIFESYSKEVRITTSGSSPVGGVTMDAVFYQGGIKKSLNNLNSGETVIMILDNKTRSLIDVNGRNIYLNGLLINSTFNLGADKNYELRVSAVGLGYLDLVLNFSAKEIPITISISPSKTEYEVGENIIFSTNPSNATILLGSTIISKNYTLNEAGNFTFTAKMENYLDAEITIKVITITNLISEKPGIEQKKGEELVFEFNKLVNYEVLYKKDAESESEIIKNGTSQVISFEVDKAGSWWLIVDGETKWEGEVKGGFSWYWYLIGGIILIIIIYFVLVKKTREEKEESGVMFAPKVGGE